MDKNAIANEWMNNFVKATKDDNLTINDYSLAIELIEKCVDTTVGELSEPNHRQLGAIRVAKILECENSTTNV